MKSQIPADAIDLLHKILQLSPIRRISAADALLHPYFHADFERKESVQKLSMINRTTETTSPCTNPNTMFFNNNHSNQQNWAWMCCWSGNVAEFWRRMRYWIIGPLVVHTPYAIKSPPRSFAHQNLPLCVNICRYKCCKFVSMFCAYSSLHSINKSITTFWAIYHSSLLYHHNQPLFALN